MNDMAYCAIPSAWLVEAGNTTAAAADDDDDDDEEEEEERERKPREETPSLLRRDTWLDKSVTGIAAADMARRKWKNNNGASSTVAAPGRYYR